MGHSQATHTSRRALSTPPTQLGSRSPNCGPRDHAQGIARYSQQERAELLSRLRGTEPSALAGNLEDPPQGMSLRHLSRKLTRPRDSAAINALWLRRQDLPTRLRHAWLCDLSGDNPARPATYHGHWDTFPSKRETTILDPVFRWGLQHRMGFPAQEAGRKRGRTPPAGQTLAIRFWMNWVDMPAACSAAKRQASSELWALLSCILLRAAWKTIAECKPVPTAARPPKSSQLVRPDLADEHPGARPQQDSPTTAHSSEETSWARPDSARPTPLRSTNGPGPTLSRCPPQRRQVHEGWLRSSVGLRPVLMRCRCQRKWTRECTRRYPRKCSRK